VIADCSSPTMMGGNEDLDTTVMRRLDEIKEAVKRPAMPPWLIGLVIFLVTQLIGGIWWAATIQARQEFFILQVTELTSRVGVLEMRINKNDTDFNERVRTRVRETIDDLDLIRIRNRGEER
jgi:hypothetical protein